MDFKPCLSMTSSGYRFSYVESDNVEQVEDAVDNAIATGSTVVLMIHRVLPDGGSLAISESGFQEIVDYVRGHNNSIDVMTMSGWYNYITGGSGKPCAGSS